MTLKETDETGWRVCLAFMGLFLLGAAVATVFACRYKIHKARKAKRQREGPQEEDVNGPSSEEAGSDLPA